MDDASAIPAAALGVRNSGEPLRFKDVELLGGFAAEPAKLGQQTVEVWTRLALTSDEPLFHRLADSLDGVIRHMAEKAGVGVNLRRADTVLFVLRPDGSAELWVDTAAVAMRCTVKRAIEARTVVFESDIADVTGMSFPCVEIDVQDKVLCLFREGWSFGLAFDFNPEGKLDLEGFQTMLGTLHRRLRYRHLYQVVSNPAVFDALVAAGWFPFVEIITSEFRDLAQQAEAGFDLAEIEPKLIAAFDADRLGHLLKRWAAKPHFAAREALLREAVEAFTGQKPISVIKIILTEIEGILNDAHKATHDGQGAKIRDLLAFAQASAEQRTGGPDTLFLPAAFGRYLAAHTFANFDPMAGTGMAGSRHAVGHGAAAQDSYTMTRALQVILTLDQLAFYT
ncbi:MULTISPECIES: hypothetical protein [Stenotrophomonas]|jgi:hypothetical protein|uniref:hypothetical protein n=1 Tax=Stenotrophomonas TaxID=40323 RepID=UPI001CE1B3BA|nr:MULTISPECIES: hypothetical protein [Stenotrophomonas]